MGVCGVPGFPDLLGQRLQYRTGICVKGKEGLRRNGNGIVLIASGHGADPAPVFQNGVQHYAAQDQGVGTLTADIASGMPAFQP